MSNMRDLLDLINEMSEDTDTVELHDSFDIEIGEDLLIESGVIEVLEDGIIIQGDDTVLELLQQHGVILSESMVMGLPGDQGSKVMGEDDKEVCPHCKKDPCECDHEEMDEAKYQGREVPLGKPMAGDVKKSKVYVKGPKGNVVKVNFGDKKMRIKKSNPKRRKSFRARHNCKNPGPRWKARYWSCRAW